jgi:predicted ATPase/DNA-binding SARP family transcriptional activator
VDGQWRIELLGGLRARKGERVVSRFPSQKAGALLAFLAYHPRPHPREALAELFWPGGDPEIVRGSLRRVLHTLRQELGSDAGGDEALLIADRVTLGLRPEAFTTDVAAWQSALQAARSAAGPERISLLVRAVELYSGELLPGCEEAWVLAERPRLAREHLAALRRLMTALEQAGDLARAIEAAHRAVRADPLREESHYDLMRLYAAAGQPSAMRRQYEELEQVLREELGETPSAATRALAEELRSNARAVGTRSTPTVLPPPGQPASHGDLHPASAPSSGPASAPPGAAAPASGLPPQFTRFFGRGEEIAQVSATLCRPETRLVTLTGPGGCGKTRLAIAVAERLEETLGGASTFVSLADLEPSASPDGGGAGTRRRIAEGIADAMGLVRSRQMEPLGQVVAALRDRSWLLILDNFEHLVTDGALLLRMLLERAPSLTCLVTSRQRLNLVGEREFVVLPLPAPHQAEPVERLGAFPSVQLFLDRARAVRPGFPLTETSTAAVAQLCQRLEGLPLAIELAAARIAVLSPVQMLAHLERQFEFLVSRQRDRPARHRTLQAAVEGSYQLLEPSLQRFFRRLSVFRGGWTLEAAEAVCREPQALDRLEQLRECSLVAVEERGDELRYRLLETLRQYGRERLLENQEAEAVNARHRDWFLALAERARAEWQGPGQKAWMDRLETEHDNLRAALAWSRQAGEVEAELRLGAALEWFWSRRGYLAEGRQWLEGALARESGAPGLVRAKAFTKVAWLAHSQGDHAASVTFAGAARALYEEHLALLRECQDRPGLLQTLRDLSEVTSLQGDGSATWMLCLETLELLREMGDRPALAATLHSLGQLALKQGTREAARAYFEESVTIRRALGDDSGLMHLLGRLGHMAREEGDYERARALYLESLALRRRLWDEIALTQSLEDLAGLAARQGEAQRAARLLGAAEARCERLGARFPLAIPEECERAVAAARAALGGDGFASAWAEGRAMSWEQALDYAVEETPPHRRA